MFFDNEKNENWHVFKKILQFGFYQTIDTITYKHINKKMDPIVFRGLSFLKKTMDEKPTKIFVVVESLLFKIKPSINSRILKTISYGEYNCENNETGYVSVYLDNHIEWLKLILKDGTTGYVFKEFTL
jgi:hypothetical protein